MTFIIFYCVFSYFFVIGVAIDGNIPVWNILFSPLIMPMFMGQFISIVVKK